MKRKRTKLTKLQISLAAIAALFFMLIVIYPGKATVVAMIAGGYIVAPEAARITQHYVFGNGEDLYLNADYIKNSPVILKNLS